MKYTKLSTLISNHIKSGNFDSKQLEQFLHPNCFFPYISIARFDLNMTPKQMDLLNIKHFYFYPMRNGIANTVNYYGRKRQFKFYSSNMKNNYCCAAKIYYIDKKPTKEWIKEQLIKKYDCFDIQEKKAELL